MEDYKRHYHLEIIKFENQSSQFNIAINERQGLLAQRAILNKMIEEEREEQKRKLADKDREKIQSLDSLKNGTHRLIQR